MYEVEETTAFEDMKEEEVFDTCTFSMKSRALCLALKYSRKQSHYCSLHGEMAERPLASDLRKFYEILSDKDRFTRRALQTVTTCAPLDLNA